MKKLTIYMLCNMSATTYYITCHYLSICERCAQNLIAYETATSQTMEFIQTFTNFPNITLQQTNEEICMILHSI